MSASPYGFRVTIERSGRKTFAPELHTFVRKTSNRALVQKSAQYKDGFLRLIKIEPLSREEFDRESRNPSLVANAGPARTHSSLSR